MKNILFPHICRPIGWIMFTLSWLIAIFLYFDLPTSTGILKTVINHLAIIGIVIGALFIACSKERVEDEMTKSIRLASLLNSLYINVITMIICVATMTGSQFISFAVLNLVLLPAIFAIIYQLEIQRYKKMFENEE